MMNNTILLGLILVGVLIIGGVVIHEANETPLESASEALEQAADDVGDAITESTN